MTAGRITRRTRQRIARIHRAVWLCVPKGEEGKRAHATFEDLTIQRLRSKPRQAKSNTYVHRANVIAIAGCWANCWSSLHS